MAEQQQDGDEKKRFRKKFKSELLQELKGHTDTAWSISWSPSSPLLASCSTDKSIRIYSYRPSSLPSSFQLSSTIPTSHTRTVRNLSFSPTGKTLATASFDSTVGLWLRPGGEEEGGEGEEGMREEEGDRRRDEGDGDGDGEWEPMDALEGHESEVKDVEWSKDGRWIASCGRDKSVWVWEVIGPAEFECAAVIMEHSQDVKSLCWHPTEELLASSSYDDTINLYRPSPYDDEWVLLTTLKSHTGTIWSSSFSPCGNYLASTGDDLKIKIWGRREVDRKGNLVDSSEKEGEKEEEEEEDGGRMGPWSNTHGSEIREKTKWVLLGDLKAHGEEEGEGDGSSGFARTCYSLDWGNNSSNPDSLGRIIVGSGDGTQRIWELFHPPKSAKPLDLPPYTHILTLSASHGVSDVNKVKWCDYAPKKAEKVRVALEGGEERVVGGGEGGGQGGMEGVWASAGDDGVVRVWRIVEDGDGDRDGDGGEEKMEE